MSSISIIIPTYNRARWLRGTFKSLNGLQVPQNIPVEVLVLDNNCTDETPGVVSEAAQSSKFPIRRIVEKQQGLCFGRNRGIAEAKHEHLIFFDDDIQIAPNWIGNYFSAVTELSADCVCGPVMPLFEGEPPPYVQGRALSCIDSWYSRRGDKPFVISPVDWGVPGCNFGVRKKVAEAIGGFNVNLDRCGKGLLSGGDTEFGRRLVQNGHCIAYHPGCAIDHVIVAEKLTIPYLRRRIWGLGVTNRCLYGMPSSKKAVKAILVAAKKWMVSRALYARGRSAEALDQELGALHTFGFYFGHGPKGLNLPQS